MASGTNKRRNEKLREQQRVDAENESGILLGLMRSVGGRRWIWLTLERARIFQGTDNLDPYVMAWEKGRRNEGLRLLSAVIAAAPTQYVQMMQENTAYRPEPEPEEEENGRSSSDTTEWGDASD